MLKTEQQKKGWDATSVVPVITHYLMTDREFTLLRQLIFDYAGIDIKPHKKTLLINRLSKRLRNLGLKTFSDYLKYIETAPQRQQEFVELIDCVTTNKTDFFREPQHFTFLQQTAIPEILRKNGTNTPIRIWSAACSTGEEPYTLAICLSETISNRNFEIVGSDVSETVLRHAAAAIYEESRIPPIPHPLLRKYFLKGDKRYKVKPELCKLVTFKKINLNHDFQHHLKNIEIIFCRNVMIYFNKTTQQEIINKFWQVLQPGGYLFLGHSETLQGMNTPFSYIAPSVYKKTKA